MKAITLTQWRQAPPGTVVEVDATSRSRLVGQGVMAVPTLATLRRVAQDRGIPGWHNMKYDTLVDRLSGGEA